LDKRYSKNVIGDVITFDGKFLRRSHDKSSNKSAIYMVSAWSGDNKITLGQVKIDFIAENSIKFNHVRVLL